MQKKTDKSIVENKVFQEIVTTEAVYNDSLKFLSTALFIEKQYEKDPTSSHSIFSKLEPMVTSLVQISDDLLLNVQKAIAAIDSSVREELKLERTEKLKEFFTLYKDYSSLYKEYTVEAQKNPDQFKRINYYMFQNSNPQLNFGSHFIMPIQRGVRYLMLVMAIQGNTVGIDEFNHEEFTQLKLMLSNGLDEANSTMTMAESSTPQKVYQYQFGDITRYILGWNSVQESTPVEVVTVKNEEPKSPPRGYKFGDGMRYLLWGNSSSAQPQAEVTSTMETKTVDGDTQEDQSDEGFVIVNPEDGGAKFNQ